MGRHICQSHGVYGEERTDPRTTTQTRPMGHHETAGTDCRVSRPIGLVDWGVNGVAYMEYDGIHGVSGTYSAYCLDMFGLFVVLLGQGLRVVSAALTSNA